MDGLGLMIFGYVKLRRNERRHDQQQTHNQNGM